MLLGLYGAGKTTTSGKLAQYYAKRGFKVAMMGLDVHRPAAKEQLMQLGKKVKIPVLTDKKEKNALKKSGYDCGKLQSSYLGTKYNKG